MNTADAHNSALAAGKGTRWSDTIRELNDCQQQLAEERKRREKAEKREIEADEDAKRQVENWSAKLDAERRDNETLMDAMKWLREELKRDEYYVEKIDIAFAKVGTYLLPGRRAK